MKKKIQWNISQNLNIFFRENAFENVVWKLGSILSRTQVLNQLSTFFQGPSGNSAAFVQVVGWHWTESKPFTKPKVTWHHLCKYVSGLSIVWTIFPVNPIKSMHVHILTQISVALKGHTFQM